MSNKFVLFLCFHLTWLTGFSQQVQVDEKGTRIYRVEPPNWWTGMEDSTLQIMVYGQNIKEATISLQHTDVSIIHVDTVKNRNYLFVNILISKKAAPGSLSFRLFENDKQVAQFNYPILSREPGSRERKGFGPSDVIYLITPDRFANGNTVNDNLPDMQDAIARDKPLGRHGGDIRGISDHLDYLEDMGFTSLWLNPVLENRMERHSYHGYAITDFYKVDPRFGTNEEYKTLALKAGERGIKLIKDMVLNHCGLNHWWMNDLPDDNWINYSGMPYQQTNHRKTLNSDPYAALEDKELMMRGWFVRTMPDLNLQNRLLGKYMIQNTIWWIEYAALSGIRMDTYPYPDESFMSQWSQRVMREYPNFNITGETWYDDPAILAYWQRGKANPNGYNSYLSSLCDFPLQSALIQALNTQGGYEDEWIKLYETLAKDFHYPQPSNLVVFADNHDMSRLYTQVKGDLAKFKMALAYVLTVRGIPQIYYGTETLLSNEGTDNHGVIRSDFPGGWAGDTVDAFQKKGLNDEQKEAMDFLKKLLHWRKTSQAIHSGTMVHYVPENGIYVYFRQAGPETIMILLNKNAEPVTLDLKRFRRMIPQKSKGVDVVTGKKIDLNDPLILTVAGPLIIRIEQ